MIELPLVLALIVALAVQDSPAAPPPAAKPEAPSLPIPPRAEVDAAIANARDLLLPKQETMKDGAPKAEWPYEGVYRVGGVIPYGYRVGGTGIVGRALVEMPGYADDRERKEAIARATAFVCDAIREPLMSPEYGGGYDVRGWGHAYGLRFLLAIERRKAIPEGSERAVAEAIRFYLDALGAIEIPEVGGWSYSRRPGLETPSATSPFMTAPVLLTLFEAKAQGHAVEDGAIERGLKALEISRADSGFVAYSAMRPAKDEPGQIPGAIGRMVAAESALFLAGRSDAERLRNAVDRFIQDWKALEARRKKSGTHVPPYGVAPYYFFYGFRMAALAIVLLPESDRASRRDALNAILFSVREVDGGWNDRVFPRSAAFGTAMVVESLLQPSLGPPPRWEAKPAEPAKPDA